MDLKKIFFVISLFFVPIFVGANFEINNFNFYKELKNTGNYFILDEDIFQASPLGVDNLKIVRSDGLEISWELKKDADIIVHHNKNKDIKIISQKKISSTETEYILDIKNNNEYHNKIEVFSPTQDYLRKVYIYGSQDKDGKYEKLNLNKDKPEVFAVAPGKNDPVIEYKFTDYRYLKLIIFPDEDDFILEKFVQNFDEVEIKKGERRFNEVKIEIDSFENKDIILLDLEKTGIFVEKLNLDFVEGIFKRRYIFYTSNNKDAIEWKKISQGEIFKNNYQDNLTLDVFDNKRFYKIVINNEESSQLHFASANFESFAQKVYLPNDLNFQKYKYRVYYGTREVKQTNNNFRVAVKNRQNVEIKLGKQEKNELFKIKEGNFIKDNLNKIILSIVILIFLFVIFWFFLKIRWEEKNKRKKGWTDEEKRKIFKK